MSREIRMVPATWEHPKTDRYGNHKYRPLYDGAEYESDKSEWEKQYKKEGLQATLDYLHTPNTEDYMPVWADEEKTHYMMYETCSEGTPLSPPMETKEGLCQWLVDNKASSFGHGTASYEWWWNVINGGIGMTQIAPGCVAI